MSAEDDVDKVNEVTAKLAGPLKVWVLNILTDGDLVGTTVYSTLEKLLEAAEEDMTREHTNADPNMVSAAVAELRRTNSSVLYVTYYDAVYTEVKV